MGKRGRYQKRGPSKVTPLMIYLEPGLLQRLSWESKYQGMSLSAIGAAILRDALEGQKQHGQTK